MDLNTTQATTTVHKMQSGIDVHQRFLSLNKGEEKFWGGFHFRIKALQGSECKHLMKNEVTVKCKFPPHYLLLA